MSRDSFDALVSRLAALGEPARRALYRYVVAQGRPVGRDEAADGVGVPRHVAKFHLDRLKEDGLLEAEFRRPPGRSGPGAGRPAKLYRRAAGELAVSLPDRRYELAGRLMAEAITSAASAGIPVQAALGTAAASLGRNFGDDVRKRVGPHPAERDVLPAISDVLDEQGYEPRIAAEKLMLSNCPFHALARDYTDLVCGMNLEIMEAMLDELPGGGFEARLEPAPERCCVTVCPRPQSGPAQPGC